MKDCHILTAAWGNTYIDMLVLTNVPTLLAEGNLPELAKEYNVIIKIYTTPDFTDKLENHPELVHLKQRYPVEIITVNETEELHRLERYTHITRLAMAEALAAGAALLLNSPDNIWADGSFRYLAKQAKRGTKIFCGSTVRSTAETMVREILRGYPIDDNGAISIGNRDLVRFSIKHMHWIERTAIWKHSPFRTFPINLYWPMASTSMIGCYYYYFPFFMTEVLGEHTDHRTIDFAYLNTIYENEPERFKREVKFILSSEILFSASLTIRDFEWPFDTQKSGSPEFVAQKAMSVVNPANRLFIQKKFWMIGEKLSILQRIKASLRVDWTLARILYITALGENEPKWLGKIGIWLKILGRIQAKLWIPACCFFQARKVIAEPAE